MVVPIPKSTTPPVQAVVQELPVLMEVSEVIIKVAGKNQPGERMSNP